MAQNNYKLNRTTDNSKKPALLALTIRSEEHTSELQSQR